MIDHKNKIIFIHLERCGGTSIEKIFTSKDWWWVTNDFLKKENFDEGHEKHITLKYAKILYKKEFSTYKKVCCIRHPYSLFISKAHWFSKDTPSDADVAVHINSKGEITKDIVNHIIKQSEKRWGIKYLHEILGEKNNYDFIIRFENYEKDYNKMLELFNLNKNTFKMKHLNKNSHKSFYKQLYLTKEAKQLIKEYSREYCKIFNYKYEVDLFTKYKN